MSDLSARVRAALRERGMSISAAARAMNFDKGYVSRVVNGKQRPSAALVTALDNLLGTEGGLVELHTAMDEDDRSRVAAVVGGDRYKADASTVRALSDVLAAQRRLDDTLGPAAMLAPTLVQMDTVVSLARDSDARSMPADVRDGLKLVAAEWVQFAGWLRAEARDDADAVRLLTEAEDYADEINDGPLAAQAANFKGYLSRQRQNARGVVRWFLTAYNTPGAHPAQRLGDAAQAAQGLAMLGERDSARRLLDEATALSHRAEIETPPGTAYWLVPSFHGLNIGLAYLALGDTTQAAASIRDALANLPEDQQGAEWTHEYRAALAQAEGES
ncbi:helix-turn-helix protein [Nocardiopsis sp. Huas11]|uniref:helix-turn-helix domain-containing protein n=1 Tax=Nocardiopsis sp. Huas11 TaxID=2183912 RepID=UPI000EACC7B7|nr:helix-turn-helix transcriptional regulator [Nocardiopsis sp. Huas11]RKS06682.1 helix-turn-helix protein [Nocardiopsis sp. Huas11]